MRTFDTMKYRKHPGGLSAVLAVFRMRFPVVLALTALFLVFSGYMMVAGDPAVKMIAVNAHAVPPKGTAGSSGDAMHYDYHFKARNLADWLAFDRGMFAGFGFFNALFTMAVLTYGYRVTRILTLRQPFLFPVANYLQVIGWIIIAGGVLNTVRYFYIAAAVRSITGGSYRADLSSASGYTLAAGIIILIAAKVYRRGCELQAERTKHSI
ncbi:DUF2975 domain-containing protein [Hufsiella ginkgonis]|uniref:DUF2975 domain-containing protein n=1 Tax=Hufsiella ginkgonis TaxID=2695274 RepID=A0A7K1Y033_9SPHI|nr:DUF2975 domain-containing protein [Hufsiella ginkgonis]MXV16427.1 DUF2975 domain-containing protein [Hufsiella ginkgonis]